ncbi:Uncharacterised protein [Achromobacter xylosoxidans]|nr:Uncharacterised protein [Achromobacter xylosoxidans]
MLQRRRGDLGQPILERDLGLIGRDEIGDAERIARDGIHARRRVHQLGRRRRDRLVIHPVVDRRQIRRKLQSPARAVGAGLGILQGAGAVGQRLARGQQGLAPPHDVVDRLDALGREDGAQRHGRLGHGGLEIDNHLVGIVVAAHGVFLGFAEGADRHQRPGRDTALQQLDEGRALLRLAIAASGQRQHRSRRQAGQADPQHCHALPSLRKTLHREHPPGGRHPPRQIIPKRPPPAAGGRILLPSNRYDTAHRRAP